MNRKRTSSIVTSLLAAWYGGALALAGGPGNADLRATSDQESAVVRAPNALIFGPHADLWHDYCCQKRPEHSPVRNYHPLVRAKHTLLPHCRCHGSSRHAWACGGATQLVGHPAFRGAGFHSVGRGTDFHHDHGHAGYPPVHVAPLHDGTTSGSTSSSPPRTTETHFEPPVQLVPAHDPVTLTPESPGRLPRIPATHPDRTGPSPPTPRATTEEGNTDSRRTIPKNLIPPRFRPSHP